jgi:hypothetical protein
VGCTVDCLPHKQCQHPSKLSLCAPKASPELASYTTAEVRKAGGADKGERRSCVMLTGEKEGHGVAALR